MLLLSCVCLLFGSFVSSLSGLPCLFGVFIISVVVSLVGVLDCSLLILALSCTYMCLSFGRVGSVWTHPSSAIDVHVAAICFSMLLPRISVLLVR